LHPPQKLQRPEIVSLCVACLSEDADDFSSSYGKIFLFGELYCDKKKILATYQGFLPECLPNKKFLP
jgi:hypothetical protein